MEGEDGKIRVAGFTTRNRAARVFTSNSITTRHADGTLETADGVIVLIKGPLNISRMHHNGFPHEVCKWFQLGFPVEWEKCANSNMKQMNEHTRSPLKSTSASSLSVSTEYYIDKFLRGSFINSMGYAFTGNDFNSSKRSTSNTDGPPIQRVSNLSNGTARFKESTGNTGDNDNLMSKMAASEELCNGRMEMPEEPFAGPGGTCNSGQAGQEDNQHESMHKYASGQKMHTHSIDSALINNHMDHISSDLEECGTPKCGKTLVHPGTEDALEVPTKGMSPQFGVHGSQDNTIRRLRNGKVFGMSSGASLKKRDYKGKRMQNKTFNRKMVPNEEITPPADLTSHKNVYNSLDIHDKAKQSSVCMPVSPGPKRTRSGQLCQVGSGHENDAHNVVGSVAGIIAADKLQSHYSCRKG